jgi:hypothetical protein
LLPRAVVARMISQFCCSVVISFDRRHTPVS